MMVIISYILISAGFGSPNDVGQWIDADHGYTIFIGKSDYTICKDRLCEKGKIVTGLGGVRKFGGFQKLKISRDILLKSGLAEYLKYSTVGKFSKKDLYVPAIMAGTQRCGGKKHFVFGDFEGRGYVFCKK